VLQENAVEVVEELHRRGYTLGIISNVITSQELPDWLETDGLTKNFKAVVLSSLFGRRKPHPSIYHEAVRRAGVQAERSVYVGDNFKRDVTGTREAGFGMVVILVEPDELEKEPPAPENTPDVIIHRFVDLLEIYPSPRQPARIPQR
jgi:HAD superfamily hydrolase (TIGR01662 family)